VGRVVPFDYSYQREGRRAPDKHDTLLATHLDALKSARKRHRGPVVLAGKSMGSRIGCHAAVALVASNPVQAVVCFGYPLRSPSGAMRDEVLTQLRTPALFVQGDADPLCPLQLLERVRPRMTAPHELYVVEGGDHSLAVGARALKASNRTAAQVERDALQAVAAFLRRAIQG
jgi:predicted alpha/beta-hydrolase family hydrolase